MPEPPPRLFAALGVTAILGTATAHAAAPAQMLAGHIDAVAASENGVIAATASGIRLLDPMGIPLRTLWTRSLPAGRTHHLVGSDGFAPLPGLTADGDWSDPVDADLPDLLDDPDDPRVADETEILTEDNGESPHRSRSGRPSPSLRPEPIAVAESRAWIGRADGLWCIDLDDGLATRVLPAAGAEIAAVTALRGGPHARETQVAVIRGAALVLSRNGGETFQTPVALESPPRSLAITTTGAVVLAIEGGLRIVAPDGRGIESIALPDVTEVASCGPDVITLAGGGLYAIRATPRAAGIEAIGRAPPGARKIMCGSDGALWVAHGAGLWTSGNHGRTWEDRLNVSLAAITGVAVTPTGIWVASSSGLWRLPSVGGAAMAAVTESGLAPSPRAAAAHSFPRAARWWTAALPRVDLSFSAARTGVHRDYRGFAVLTFFLDRTRFFAARGGAPSSAFRYGASDEVRLLGAPRGRAECGGSVDLVTAAECRALANALEETP